MSKWQFIGSDNKNCITEAEIEILCREEGAEVICLMPQAENKSPGLLDILLDEQYAWYGFWVTEECYVQSGGSNLRLGKGKNYELLVRLAAHTKILCIECGQLKTEDLQSGSFFTDAYLLSRYAEVLKEAGCFESYLESCVQSAAGEADGAEKIAYLEAMLKKDTIYWEIFRQTQPFLILLGDDFCYNILNEMAQTLIHGLHECGQQVEICDLAVDKRQKLAGLAGKCYKAVVGFQSFISNIYLQGADCYLADMIYAPKLEMVFDHPFWFYEPFKAHGKNFYVLTHDENYVRFAEHYGRNISGSYLIPPAGAVSKYSEKKRELDVVFIGTYNDYRGKLSGMYAADGQIRHMAAHYLKYLRKDVNAPAEEAFLKMLSDFGLEPEREVFSEMMCQMGDACQCIMYYYREKIIRTLLDAGIILHVYGDSWKNSPFMESPFLRWHREIPAEKSRSVLEAAKISLNVLAWHKGGCNERIIHSMLAGAVVVTDKSSYIESHFQDGKEIFCYDLKDLSKLPKLVCTLLSQEELRNGVQRAGYQKAAEEYSSRKQAERIIRLAETIELEA